MRTMLKSKIHRATVTGANIAYEGSITLDKTLMEAADILPYEMVHVLDVNNGERFQTYAIEGEADSGSVILNGAAARLVSNGDIVIILTYNTVTNEEAQFIEPRLVYVDADNAIRTQKNGRKWMDDLAQSLKEDVSAHTM
jgi:aspartate 1-decarboxylase